MTDEHDYSAYTWKCMGCGSKYFGYHTCGKHPTLQEFAEAHPERFTPEAMKESSDFLAAIDAEIQGLVDARDRKRKADLN